MTAVLKIVSLLAVLATLLPSFFYLAGTLSLDSVKWIALVGTLVWFVTTPLWMGRSLPPDADQVQI